MLLMMTRFHNIILSSCGNPWLQDTLTSLTLSYRKISIIVSSILIVLIYLVILWGKVLEGNKGEKDLDKVEQYARKHIDEFVLKIKKRNVIEFRKPPQF